MAVERPMRSPGRGRVDAGGEQAEEGAEERPQTSIPRRRRQRSEEVKPNFREFFYPLRAIA